MTQQDPGQPPKDDPVSSFSDPKLIRPVARGPLPVPPAEPAPTHRVWIVYMVIAAAILVIVLAFIY